MPLEISAGFASIHTVTMLKQSLAGRAPNIPCKQTCSHRPGTERLQSHAIRVAVREADTSFLMVLATAVGSATLAALPVFAAAFVALSVNTQNWQNAPVDPGRPCRPGKAHNPNNRPGCANPTSPPGARVRACRAPERERA